MVEEGGQKMVQTHILVRLFKMIKSLSYDVRFWRCFKSPNVLGMVGGGVEDRKKCWKEDDINNILGNIIHRINSSNNNIRSHEGQFNKELGKYYLMFPSLFFHKTMFYGHT